MLRGGIWQNCFLYLCVFFKKSTHSLIYPFIHSPGFRCEWDILSVLNLLTEKNSQRNRQSQPERYYVQEVTTLHLPQNRTWEKGKELWNNEFNPNENLTKMMELGTQIAWSWSWNLPINSRCLWCSHSGKQHGEYSKNSKWNFLMTQWLHFWVYILKKP